MPGTDVDTVEQINARSMLNAAAASAAELGAAHGPGLERRRRLSQAALSVSNQKVQRPYSPIVIAGVVRVLDFVLLNIIGIALYLGYVARSKRVSLGIYRGDLRHNHDRIDLLSGRRHLPSAGFSGTVPAIEPNDFVLGVRVPAVHRRIVLCQARG